MQAFRQRAFAGRQGVSAGTSRRVLVCVAKESRIGRAPVPIAKGVEVKLNGNSLKVKVRWRDALIIRHIMFDRYAGGGGAGGAAGRRQAAGGRGLASGPLPTHTRAPPPARVPAGPARHAGAHLP